MNSLVLLAAWVVLVPLALGMVNQGPCPTNLPAYNNFNPQSLVGKQYIVYSTSYFAQYRGPCFYKDSHMLANGTINFTEYWRNEQTNMFFNISGYAIPNDAHPGYYTLHLNYPNYFPTSFYNDIYFVVLDVQADYYLAWTCRQFENAHIEHAFVVSTHKTLPASTAQTCMNFLNHVKAHTEDFIATQYPEYCPF